MKAQDIDRISANEPYGTDSIILKPQKSAKIIEVLAPVSLITYGLISLENGAIKKLDYSTQFELHEDNRMLLHHTDDYLQFSPAFVAFGLKLFNVESKHTYQEMAILYALSNLLETGIVYSTKSITP